MTLRLFFFSFLITQFLSTRVESQCVTSSVHDIPDDDSLYIHLLVSGLVDSDLASVTQGICSVHIDFMHEYLGDLTISLVSPSGTIITLVGPVTTATTPTNLSRWRIQFMPCMAAAVPDAGFTAVWSNLQPWQVFTNYSGSYHPNSGCLEDFNSGPANGIWSIIVEDHDILQTGIITSASLFFCNPVGLQCLECDPNSGILNPAAIVLCEGENIQSTDLTLDFGGSPPSPAIYSYEYLLLSGNTIISSGTSFSENPLPGLYSICGMSYLTADSAAVNNLLSAGNFNQLELAITNGNICALLTSACVDVNVLSIPDTLVTDVFLCQGESFVFKSQLFSSAGTFHIVEDGIGMCDSVFRLNISVSDLAAIIAVPDSIACGGSGVMLDGSFSNGGTGSFSFQWTTTSGVLSGNINSTQVIALAPATYTLTIDDGICMVSRDVIVHEDLTYPRIFMQGGILTCVQTSVAIHPIVFPSNVTFSWTGPGGFTSTMQDIVATVPGRYFLRVTSSIGCEVVSYVDIIEDTQAPDATIVLIDKVCESGFGVIAATSANNIYQWSGPVGGLPGDQIIGVSTIGQYSVTVTNPLNGCVANSTYDFNPDFTVPPLIILGIDSIRCNQDVSISITNTGISGVPHFTGPNGFVTGGFDVLLTQPGIYVIQILGLNGCRNIDIIEIFGASDYPAFTVTNDTISCTDNIATISISVPGADVYNWLNLPPPESGNASVQVLIPGFYPVTALDTNSGCLIETHAFVYSNLAPPLFNFQNDVISCMEPVATLSFIPVAGQIYTDIHWQLLDMSIVTSTTINTSEAGQYLLSVTGENGCVGSALLAVGVDTMPPVFFVEADSLGCDLQSHINIIEVNPLQSISWNGPGGFTSFQLNPIVTNTGIYTAIGTSPNGCTMLASVNIHSNFRPPAGITSKDSLTCLNPFAELAISSTEPILSYEWMDPAGVIIGTDSFVLVSNPGIYTIQMEGENHCIALDSIVLDPVIYPVITVFSDTLTCAVDTIALMAESDLANSSFIWLNASDDTLSFLDQLEVNGTGPFTIAVTAPNGCETRDTLLIPIDTLSPISIISMIGEVRCQKRDFILDGAGSIPSNVNYTWTALQGMIIGPDDLALAEARDTGTYFLLVEDPDNGCTDIDTLHVSEHPSSITKMFLEIKPPECSGDANGQIQVNGVQGGIEPFLFQFESFPPQSLSVFPGLAAGSYLVRIYDAEGCIYDSIVTIIPTNPFIADAGPDIEIFIGDSAFLTGSSDIDPAFIISESWDSAGVMMLCADCLETVVAPFVTSSYSFQVISSTGCVVQDEMIVYVIEKGKFFIPNVFTPDGDNVNDEIRFYPSPGIVKVLKWIIFDRWGDAVFGRTDFVPDDPLVFWDGTTQGSVTLNPGVFPYIIEVELVNGNREVHHGNITLLR